MKQEDLERPAVRLVVTAAEAGCRLDLFLAERVAGLSRSQAQKLLRSGVVFINEQPCLDKNYRLQETDLVGLTMPEPEETMIEPEDIRLAVVYEDRDLLVVDKPRGMVVHPAPGHSRGTLVNALLNHCDDLSGIGGIRRPGIVHRLDKDTSGLLIVAKNDLAHRRLSAQLKARVINREYIALVNGLVRPAHGRIEAPVGRHPVHRKKMAVVESGREAVTRYRTIKTYHRYSLLQLQLETGRTHQIRVHLSYLGYPVVGDLLYAGNLSGGLPAELVFSQALHARRISFTHPVSGIKMSFSTPLPPEFAGLLLWLKEQAKP
jgi:23S rRNA pseudouridine1911/1915/1917 synthase